MPRPLLLLALVSLWMTVPVAANPYGLPDRECSVPAAPGSHIEVGYCLDEVTWPGDISAGVPSSPRFTVGHIIPKPPTARTYSVHLSLLNDEMQGLYVRECWGFMGRPVGFFLPARWEKDPNWGPVYSRLHAEARLGDPPGCGRTGKATP